MPTNNPVPSTDPSDLLFNAGKLDEAVNSSANTYTDRLGAQRRTLIGLEAEFPNAAANAAAAAASAVDAADSAQTAQDEAAAAAAQASAADASRVAAEAARDAAQLSAGVYATTAAGLAATTSGRYFSVPSADSAEYLILYLNSSGTAVEVKRYPSVNAFDWVSKALVPGTAFSIADQNNQTAFEVTDSGQTRAADLYVKEINGITDATLAGVAQTMQGVNNALQPGVALAIAGEDGKTALEIKDDGGLAIQSLTVETINGKSISEIMAGTVAPEGDFTYELNFISNNGQSLAQGPVPIGVSMTPTQEYDNIGFQWAASSPTQYYPLTTANTQWEPTPGDGRGESPMYGTLGHIKALIQSENGLSYTDHKYQLLTCNNGRGGTAISQHVKGTAFYSATMSQVQSGFNIAQAEKRTFAFQAFTWTQGEADSGTTTRAAYTAALRQMVADYNADAKAITGQTEDVICITYQLSSQTIKDISLALLDAGEQDPLIYTACPMYFFEYGDSVHITAESSKWLGGYYGLVYKRVKIDKVDWKPLSVKEIRKQGAILNVQFHVPEAPIVFDTVSVGPKTNYGFSLVDSAGVALSISSVEIIQRDTVKVTAAATIPAGAKLRYGFSAGGGNLRDSQGNTLIYEAINKPMHNWCVIFEKAI